VRAERQNVHRTVAFVEVEDRSPDDAVREGRIDHSGVLELSFLFRVLLRVASSDAINSAIVGRNAAELTLY
jgi:hypothetical protein